MKISHSQVTEQRNGELWEVFVHGTDDEGVTRLLGGHTFPKEVLESRAAEYDLDPQDTATLLEIVLIEPHLSPEEWATGYLLGDAPDIATARADHLARITAAKLRLRISTRTPADPAVRSFLAGKLGKAQATNELDVVRDTSPMDAEVMKDKKVLLRRARKALVDARNTDGGTSRRERFRKAVDKNTNKEPDRG